MILHLIETGGPGGAEQMLLRLADEYALRGIAQAVCLRKDGWLASEVRRRGYILKIKPLSGLPDIGWLSELRNWSVEQGVTSIHSHEFAMNVRGTILGRLLHVPVVATVHGLGYFGDKLARRVLYRLCSRSARFVAVSEDIRNALITKGGLKADRIRVIPNGVDTERFQFDESSRRTMRMKLGIEDSHILLGTVGSYYPVKGQKFLIEALTILVNDHPDIRLVIAGQGPLEEDLRHQIENSGLQDVVNIVGYIEDTPGFLSALDIFVLPSLSEGQPLALLEAAANGRCIVATSVGGIPEIITNNVSGLLVPAGDKKSLADAITLLIKQPELRNKLSQTCTSVIQKQWSIKRTADRYLEILTGDLLNPPSQINEKN